MPAAASACSALLRPCSEGGRGEVKKKKMVRIGGKKSGWEGMDGWKEE